LPSGTTSPRSTATLALPVEDADVGADLGRGLGRIVLRVEEATVGQKQHRRLALAFDPRVAEVEAAVALELRQRLRRLLARQQHRVAEVKAALGIGQELVAQDALVDLHAVFLGLAQLGFRLDLGLRRREAGHKGGGFVDQPLDAHEFGAIVGQPVVERARVAAQEGEAGLARGPASAIRPARRQQHHGSAWRAGGRDVPAALRQ
jgi:hypothetical protein